MKMIWKILKRLLLPFVIIVSFVIALLFLQSNQDKPAPDTSTSVVVQMKEQIEQLNENMEMMMLVLSDKEATIQVMSVELEETTDELNSTKRAMDILCDDIDAKNATIAQLEQDKAEQQAKFDELSQDVTANKEEIDKVKVELERISTELAKEKSDLDALEIKVNQIESKVAELEIKIENHGTDIETIKQDINQIETNIFNLQKQIDDLQKSIDELKANSVQVVESGSNFIRYTSGIQMSWGSANTDNFVGFGKAFKDTNYSVVCTYITSTGAWESVLVTWKGTDSCYVASGQTSNKIAFNFLAIGYWR